MLYLSPVQVGSLRVRTNLSVAWIECDSARTRNAPGDPRPDCVSAGRARAEVRMVDSTTDTATRGSDLVAEGTDIDPRSLRLDGSDLSWIQAGERRHAELR